MAGTKSGGLLAKQRNYERHGKDFYRKIGAIGGANGTTGGFAAMSPEKRRAAGRKGGLNSRRLASYKQQGMKVYMSKTKSIHFGLDYQDWQSSLLLSTPVPKQAEMFNVATGTILRWRKQTKLEADVDRPWWRRTISS